MARMSNGRWSKQVSKWTPVDRRVDRNNLSMYITDFKHVQRNNLNHNDMLLQLYVVITQGIAKDSDNI